MSAKKATAPQLRDRIVEFRRVPSDELADNPRNWRRHPQAQRRALDELLDRIGIAGAVLAYHSARNDGRLTLIDGHERRGHDAEWPTLILDVDDAEADLLLATFDPLAQLAVTDAAALGQLLDDVSISNDALARLLNEQAGRVTTSRTHPDQVPEPPSGEPVTRTGDLWLLGDHRLLCGDSAIEADVARLMQTTPAQMVLADPPYNVNYRGGSSAKTRVRGDAYPDRRSDYAEWLTAILRNGAALSDAAAALHLWHSSSELVAVMQAVYGARWQHRSLIIWDKGSIKGGLGQSGKQYRTQFEPLLYCHKRGKTPRWRGPGNESDVWAEPGPSANSFHPTMKPVALYERSLRNHTDRGDVVLELFGGSGTALIPAHRMERVSRLIEISPRYCDIICRRFQEHTGVVPVLERTGVAHDFVAAEAAA